MHTLETSDQWINVISGRGRVTVEGHQVELKAGSLLRIQAGERHQVEPIGDVPLVSMNLYAPPEY